MRNVTNASTHEGGTTTQLCVGYAGGGKTQGLVTLRGKKFAYTFESKAMDTLRGFDIDVIDFVPENIDLDAVTLKADRRDSYSKAPEPRTYVEFETDFEERIASGFFNDYDVIAFDSATMLQDIVMDRVMFLNGRFGKWPEMADWTATMNTIIKILRSAVGLRKSDGSHLTVYLTAHITMEKDGTTDKIMHQMNFIGKLKARIPVLFSNIWLCYAEPDKDGKTKWFVRTQPDRYNPFLVTSSVRGLNAIEDVTIDDWKDPVGEGIGGLLAYKG